MTTLVPTAGAAPFDAPARTAARDRAHDQELAWREFGDFVEATLPSLMRYGYSLTGNQHDAADLVQGVLERVGARWGTLRSREIDPNAYVRRAMANAHVSRWRRLRKERLVSELPDEAAAPRHDRLEDEPLWLALQDLPPRQRAVIVLRYYEGMSEAEIADTLGVRKGTVKSQAAKALASLRGRLGEDELR